MKRTTNDTMKRTTFAKLAVGMALVAALAPGVAALPADAYAATPANAVTDADEASKALKSANRGLSRILESGESAAEVQAKLSTAKSDDEQKSAAAEETQANESGQKHDLSSERRDSDGANAAMEKVLEYNPDDLAAIGTQESTGHSICCPSFSCAYADAVMDGTVHDHEYYTCSCCSWTDWGGGESSYRCVGSDEELLREAYDQISQGRPTVIHVAAGYGEHWIALIGYTGAVDPNNLTLENFVALDPWDGAQIIAAERFSLYGDGCEHISQR